MEDGIWIFILDTNTVERKPTRLPRYVAVAYRPDEGFEDLPLGGIFWLSNQEPTPLDLAALAAQVP